MSAVIENLIIGTGPAGIATAMAFRRHGVPFEVLDVGYDLDTAIDKDVQELANLNPSDWEKKTANRLFPPPVSSTNGVERRLLFGSDFPYRVPHSLSVKRDHCTTEFSHGLGGFGNVWGAAMLPYSDHSIRDWPIPKNKLKESYANVLQYVPLSAEEDELIDTFPVYSRRFSTLKRSKQTEALLKALNSRKTHLYQTGVKFGRARVAVDSSASSSSCRYCGHCLDGCVYGSIFNPRLMCRQLEADNVIFHKGFSVLEFKEFDNFVLVTAVNTNDGSISQWKVKRLYLAAGHFSTARIIARSLGRYNDNIRISDSQYFFFPLLSYRGVEADMGFTLAEVFVEILNEQLSPNYIHFQVYGVNNIFEQTLRSLIPRPLPLSPIVNRLYLFQGFLHSEDSGHLELNLLSSSNKGDKILVRGIENPKAILTAKKARALLRKSLLRFGLIPPLPLTLIPPGRSFHAGGSFPMGGNHPFYRSDTFGRPSGLKRVHIVDSANFPSVAGSSIAFTIMANADRIVNAVIEARLP